MDIYIKPNVYQINSLCQDDSEFEEDQSSDLIIEADKYIENWYHEEMSDILLLLGEPGHGKSSFCKKMVYDYYYDITKTIPKMFYFSLNPNDSFLIENGKLVLKNVFQIKQDTLLDLGKLENSIVFLDGFDELYIALQETGCKNITGFIDIVLSFAQENNFKVVITSRKSCINIEDKRLLNKQIPIIGLASLTKIQQERFIKTYNKLFNNKCDINKLETMHKNKQIKELIQIPILFQLIVDNDINLNIKNQIELYHNIFEEIIVNRNHKATKDIEEFDIQKELE